MAIGKSPSSFASQFARYAASVIMTVGTKGACRCSKRKLTYEIFFAKVTYDYPVVSLDDPLLRRVQTALGQLGKWVRPSGTAPDHFPFLTWLPKVVNPWKKTGYALHDEELSLFLGEYLKVRKREREGKVQPCFSTQLQEKQTKLNLTDEQASASYLLKKKFTSDITSLQCIRLPILLARYLALVAILLPRHCLFLSWPCYDILKFSRKRKLRLIE